MSILDETDIQSTSGKGGMRTYRTGAFRSQEGAKLDIKGFMSPHAIEAYCNYMQRHRKMANGEMRGASNWKNGIPEDDYSTSLIRHTHDFHRSVEGAVILDKDTGERISSQDLVCAILFNAMGLLHEWNKPGNS